MVFVDNDYFNPAVYNTLCNLLLLLQNHQLQPLYNKTIASWDINTLNLLFIFSCLLPWLVFVSCVDKNGHYSHIFLHSAHFTPIITYIPLFSRHIGSYIAQSLYSAHFSSTFWAPTIFAYDTPLI